MVREYHSDSHNYLGEAKVKKSRDEAFAVIDEAGRSLTWEQAIAQVLAAPVGVDLLDNKSGGTVQ